MRYLAYLLPFVISLNLNAQSFPDGFFKEVAYSNFDIPAGILHTDSEYAFVWELNGKVWMIKNGEVHDTPVIDISEEVGFWGDQGMIGATLDPSFLENGFIYLLYSVDRHHLLHYNTPAYSADSSEADVPSIGRITRYQLNTVDFEFAIPDSRIILLGDKLNNGFPISAPSHGVGSLAFGEDGSLLASCGDGTSWVLGDDGLGYNGNGPLPNFAYDSIAYEQGTLAAKELIGAYRAQSLESLNGKVIRINPSTGNGMPGNPYFDPNNPQSKSSKIWALGFRNPYRMSHRPNTGDQSSPGTFFLSDVGDWVWEEINAISGPGKNFGWPLYQGHYQHAAYYNKPTANEQTQNPIAVFDPNCSVHYNFQDLLTPPIQSHSEVFVNPCDSSEIIANDQFTFVMEPPVLAYTHNAAEIPSTEIPLFDSDGMSTGGKIEDLGGVLGDSFKGTGGSGGVFLSGDLIPEYYRGWYIQGDFSGWLRAFDFTESNQLREVELWDDQIGAVIHVSQDPTDNCIYVTTVWPSKIYRICFGGNRKPIAKCTPDIVFGPTPQTVKFDASESVDPDGEIESFEWFLNNGESMLGPTWNYTFSTPNEEVYTYEMKLVITDNEGAQDSLTIPISLNNTPPTPIISSIADSLQISIQKPFETDLIAEVIDNEHSIEDISLEWTVFLHHNEHFHRLEGFEGNFNNTTLIHPGCHELENYWFRIFLKVTDPGGLSGTTEIEVFPDCDDSSTSTSDPYITIYPNPTRDRLFLISNFSDTNTVQYELFSSTGAKLSQSKLESIEAFVPVAIPIDHLESAVYILRFQGTIHSQVIRFIKNDL